MNAIHHNICAEADRLLKTQTSSPHLTQASRLDDISLRLVQAKQVLGVAENRIVEDIVGDQMHAEECDVILSLLAVVSRDLEGIQDVIHGAYKHLLSATPRSTPDPRWAAALELFRNSQSDGGKHQTETPGNALEALIHTRAPDLASLAEKMRIVRSTDTVLADGFFDQIVTDAEQLLNRP